MHTLNTCTLHTPLHCMHYNTCIQCLAFSTTCIAYITHSTHITHFAHIHYIIFHTLHTLPTLQTLHALHHYNHYTHCIKHLHHKQSMHYIQYIHYIHSIHYIHRVGAFLFVNRLIHVGVTDLNWSELVPSSAPLNSWSFRSCRLGFGITSGPWAGHTYTHTYNDACIHTYIYTHTEKDMHACIQRDRQT